MKFIAPGDVIPYHPCDSVRDQYHHDKIYTRYLVRYLKDRYIRDLHDLGHIYRLGQA